MSSYTARYNETAEDIIGEENLRKLKRMGMTENQLMNLYNNTFNNDKEKFQNAVKKALENEGLEKTHREIKDQMQNLIQQFENLQQLEKKLPEKTMEKHAEEEEK